ncbi:hypothetical protein TRFO_25038 [Tritrichomonas foetus]|uniref:Uncharacterized protein n=1 Tax=Tritrichomonas foetus TaxID=1144522 RepID=A0A1J4KAZ3_9EUKA|nr:hypothetical protein TRFO_25038 [Tritrichomonas foetus]|eukprot:OHT06862.1 hypothetical protein TRFO_25038 [Tritrichomonas foetus]
MSRQSKSSESVESILKQIKEFTENDSSSSTPVENMNDLIDDITITSSQSESNAEIPQELSEDDDDVHTSENDADPDLQFFLMKISKMTNHDVDNLDDATKEFQNMKFTEDGNAESPVDYGDFINQFNDKFNVVTTSLDEVMDMVEIMQENKSSQLNPFDSSSQPNGKINYFPDILKNIDDEFSDESIREREKQINDLINQQTQRNMSSSKQRRSSDSFTHSDSKSHPQKSFNKEDNIFSDNNNVKPKISRPHSSLQNGRRQSERMSSTVSSRAEDLDDFTNSQNSRFSNHSNENSFQNEENNLNSSFSHSKSSRYSQNSKLGNQPKDNDKMNSSISSKRNYNETLISNKSNSQSSNHTQSSNNSRSNLINELINNQINDPINKHAESNYSNGSQRNSYSRNSRSKSVDYTSYKKHQFEKENVLTENDEEEEVGNLSYSSQISNRNSKLSSTNSSKSNSTNKKLNRNDQFNNLSDNFSDSFEMENKNTPNISSSSLTTPSKRSSSSSNRNNHKNFFTNSTNSNSNSNTNSSRTSKSNKQSQSTTSTPNRVINSMTSTPYSKSSRSDHTESFMKISQRDELSSSYIPPHISKRTSSSLSRRSASETRSKSQSFQNEYDDANNEEFFDTGENSRSVQSFNKNYNHSRGSSIERENEELEFNNRRLISELDVLKRKIAELETENEQLKFAAMNSEEKVASIEHLNEKLQSQVSYQNEQIENLNNTKSNLQKVLDDFEKLLDNSSEVTKLTQQREQLLKVLQVHETIHQQYDQIIEHLNSEKSKFERINSSDKTNQFHEENSNDKKINNELIKPKDNTEIEDLLFKVCKASVRIGCNEANQIKDDNSGVSSSVKILKIVNLLCNQILENSLQKDENSKNHRNPKEEKDFDGNDEIRELKNQNRQTLQVLEGELRFLQKLSHSNDLQKVVFYRPSQGKSLTIDKTAQSELIRHCVVVQKYIDDTIGFYSKDQIETLSKDFECTDAQRIFTIMRTNEFEKKMKYIISFISPIYDNNNDDGEGDNKRILADLFFAISIMNEILQNHIVDLQSQLVYASHQNQKLQLQLKDDESNKIMLDEANKVLKKLQHRENKIKKKLIHFLESDTDENESLNLSSTSAASSNSHKSSSSTSKQSLSSTVVSFCTEFKKLKEKYSVKSREIEAILIKAEEMKKCYRQKIEKKNKTSKTLKKIITSQKVELEKSVSMKEEIEKKYNLLKIDSTNKIETMKNRLHEIETVCDELRKMVGQLKDEHHKQIEVLQNTCNSRFSSFEQSFESSSKDRETMTLLLKEKQILQNKIAADKRSFKRTIMEVQNQTQKFRGQYEQLSLEAKTLRIENEKLTSDANQALSDYEKMKSELDSANISKKSLELKLKAAEEKFENEKRTLQSQLSAKITSLQSDLQNQLKEDQSKQVQLIQQICEVSAKYLDLNNSKFNSPVIVVKSLCQIIDDLKKSRDQYCTIVNDVTGAQEILGLTENASLSESLTTMIKKLNDANSKINELEKSKKILNEKLAKTVNETANLQSQVACANQWEVWARRINGIVNDSHCATYSPDQLRLSLEESILASVAQRTLIFRVNTLREEKKAYIKFNKSILTERSIINPSWGVVLSIFIATRRMQQLAGCTPIRIGQAAPSVVDESPSKNKRRSRKDEIPHSHKNNKKPLRALASLV